MNVKTLEAIRPVKHSRVIDLVEQAGMDVQDWANYKGAHPSANPRYCYEWAFVDKTNVVVLNLWFGNMNLDDNGRIVAPLNLRQWAIKLEGDGGRPVWARRARSFDSALQDAVRLKLPVRVIVNDGKQEESDDIPDKASSVKRRMLDEEVWSIETYDWNTGECLLVRGLAGMRYVDQFSLTEDDAEAKTVHRAGDVFVRNPAIRSSVLTRAAGCCEYCDEPGFETAAGGIYLESHHVIPLGEGGPDTVENVVALCPGCHRQAHHGVERDAIRSRLREILGRKFSQEE